MQPFAHEHFSLALAHLSAAEEIGRMVGGSPPHHHTYDAGWIKGCILMDLDWTLGPPFPDRDGEALPGRVSTHCQVGVVSVACTGYSLALDTFRVGGWSALGSQCLFNCA
jgi:hypothetical protein